MLLLKGAPYVEQAVVLSGHSIVEAILRRGEVKAEFADDATPYP
jgi:hypothetical protein